MNRVVFIYRIILSIDKNYYEPGLKKMKHKTLKKGICFDESGARQQILSEL